MITSWASIGFGCSRSRDRLHDPLLAMEVFNVTVGKEGWTVCVSFWFTTMLAAHY
jgi:hypothetical protein